MSLPQGPLVRLIFFTDTERPLREAIISWLTSVDLHTARYEQAFCKLVLRKFMVERGLDNTIFGCSH